MKSVYRNHCLAVVILSTALPTAAWADLSGSAVLAVNTTLNLDTGDRSFTGGDILFTGSSINPQGSAGAANFSPQTGFVEFDALTLANLSAITRVNYTQIPLSGTSLVINDVFAVYTNGGHYAKVLITGLGSQGVSLKYTTYGASVSGPPLITLVQNNYSFILPPWPNYGIAPGSLFIISGNNLSSSAPPVLQSSAAPGLPQSLNQTSLSVTVNGVTTAPSLYYTSATQVAAVLPSTTPSGFGTITLTYNGQTNTSPIHVVPSALGLDTVYGIGTGQAVVTDAINNLLGFTNPAQAGQTVTLWGSGVGADLSNDDRTYPMKQNNLTGIPMQVYIGGISANILYRGRSQYPGVDQINVVIPPNVSPGCFVSVVAVSGSIVSNTVTIPVGLNVGPCSDPNLSYSGRQFQSLASKTNVEVGTILVGETLAPSGIVWNAGATFQVVQSGLYGSGYGNASEGSCVVNPPSVSTQGPFQSYGLDAGTIAVTWPGGLDIMNEMPGVPGYYIGSLGPGPPDPGSQGIQYSFVGTGGKDIGPFSSGVTLESPPLIWTNQNLFSSLTRSQGATVTWSDSTTGLSNDVEIRGSSTSSPLNAPPVTGNFVCHAGVTAGSFTIPPSILMALPAGNGTLTVTHLFSGLYAANGPFDLFQAFGRVGPPTLLTTYN